MDFFSDFASVICVLSLDSVFMRCGIIWFVLGFRLTSVRCGLSLDSVLVRCGIMWFVLGFHSVIDNSMWAVLGFRFSEMWPPGIIQFVLGFRFTSVRRGLSLDSVLLRCGMIWFVLGFRSLIEHVGCPRISLSENSCDIYKITVSCRKSVTAGSEITNLSSVKLLIDSGI